MQIRYEPIWRRCPKKEYEKYEGTYKGFMDFIKKPVYDGPAPQGLLAQIQPETRKIIGYQYFRKCGEKPVLICSSLELELLQPWVK